jgi:hypothetical protein
MTPNAMQLRWLEEQGISNLRHIGGVLCGTQDYLTTRAVLVGVGLDSPYERRYCYQNREEATAALAAYEDASKHPGGAWIKVKGRYQGAWIDAMNPRWPDLQPWDEVAPD